ncbi:conservoned domain protein [Nonlabens tegetincola]|uniref:Conservoned domain protein n=1 Tax=Nonlabens tegetincola TaxID=323273 RepID=A0A090Q5W1_9FLAO|nr:glycosyltransferase family 4 protein [Nonlabens tegetincola]GAK97153.1 conservoned domain protein [Nonlabens tegetincola]
MQSNKKLLIIGAHWPNPNGSGTGTRMIQLIETFQSQYEIHFATVLPIDDNFCNRHTICGHRIELNNQSFNEFVAEYSFSHVLYDRFMIEEQYSWRIRKVLPECIHILDTEDLHFLRKAREEAYLKDSIVNFDNEYTYREIAAILRVDYSLIIANYEIELLKSHFNIPLEKLVFVPFLFKNIECPIVNFDDREHFVFVGSGKHRPNIETIKLLKNSIWPLIRQSLPKVELHVYGYELPAFVNQMHSKEDGFIVKGFCENIEEELTKYKLMLAPIPYGAGIKTKIFDALRCSLPINGSVYLWEGISSEKIALDSIETIDKQLFVSKSVKLYQDHSLLGELLNYHLELCNTLLKRQTTVKKVLLNTILVGSSSKLSIEQRMIRYFSQKQYEFFSRFLEQKNINS